MALNSNCTTTAAKAARRTGGQGGQSGYYKRPHGLARRRPRRPERPAAKAARAATTKGVTISPPPQMKIVGSTPPEQLHVIGVGHAVAVAPLEEHMHSTRTSIVLDRDELHPHVHVWERCSWSNLWRCWGACPFARSLANHSKQRFSEHPWR
jgi:hypothetical protein